MKLTKVFTILGTAIFTAACMSFSVYAADDIAIDEANFPDETLRGYISENFDTDQSGSLSEEEIENAAELSLTDPIFDENDNLLQPDLDLTGIEHLKKLKSINVGYYNVKNADLSKIEALTEIGFSGGNVSGLVLGDMSSLEGCDIYNSDLTEISLIDCPNLVQCYFDDNPDLTKIEVKNAENLRMLGCRNDALISLKVENCAKLISVDCSNNKLTKLDITDCPLLSSINCRNNMIAELDISQFNNIIEGLKNNDRHGDKEPPLTVDSSTKIIGYDATADESSESAASTPESAASSKPQEKEKGSNTAMLVVILAAIVAAGAAAAVIIVMVKGGKDDK